MHRPIDETGDHYRRALTTWATACALSACSSPVPETTDFCGGHGEATAEIGVAATGSYDLVFVIESELVARVSAQVEAMVRQLITGDSDGDGLQDRYAEPFLRLAVLVPEEVGALNAVLGCRSQPQGTCPPTELAHVEYRYYPYGYEDDAEAFMESVRCLLSSAGRGGESCQSRQAEDELPHEPFAAWAEVVIISDRDLCAEQEPDCAGDPLRALLARAAESALPMSLVAGIPADLLDEAGLAELDLDREGYIAGLLGDARLAEGAAPFDCGGALAQPARRFLQALASDAYWGTVQSLCAFDAGELVDHTYFACGFHRDYGSWQVHPAVLVEPDGRVRCELTETLPTSGRLTRCDQLAEFGRTPHGVTEDGHDICRIEQLAPAGDTAPAGHGFYVTEGEPPEVTGRAPLRTDFGHPCVGMIGGYEPHFELTRETPTIEGSVLKMNCELTHGDVAGCE